MARDSWDQYFMSIAHQVRMRSTCPPRGPDSPNGVGAVLVRDNTILSTGYNGSIRGLPHCEDVGHIMENNHCIATVHAEANAVAQAAKNGVRIDGATLYVTVSPCWPCFKLVANAGIIRIVCGEIYGSDRRMFGAASATGIVMSLMVTK